MAVNRRKTKEQQCEPGFHLRPAFPEEAGLFHALTPEEDEAMGTAGHDQQLWQEDHPVGKVAFTSGKEEIFTDPQKYLDAVREELPFMTTTGFRYQTLTKDPRVRKAVDDILLDFAGEENSFKLEDYGLTEEGKKALRDAADPKLTHTYNWYVITNCGSPKRKPSGYTRIPMKKKNGWVLPRTKLLQWILSVWQIVSSSSLGTARLWTASRMIQLSCRRSRYFIRHWERKIPYKV